MQERDPSAARNLCEDPLEVLRAKGYIAPEDTVFARRPDNLSEDCRVAGRPRAWAPVRKSQVLLALRFVQVSAESAVELARHCNRELECRQARSVVGHATSPRTVRMCVHNALGVTGRSNRRLRYCHSGPIPLAWLESVPVGTSAGRQWIAAGGTKGTDGEH